jgi:ribosomal protein S18 acetylase RimI-like enzyme
VPGFTGPTDIDGLTDIDVVAGFSRPPNPPVTDTPVTIRRATRTDGPALGRLGALLLRTHYAFDAQRFLPPGRDPESGYGWFLESQLEDDDVAVFVAEQSGEVIGYVYVGLEPKSWKELRDASGFIHDVAVVEHGRRLGVAMALVEAGTAWLRERGAPRVLLWTAAQNAAAQSLFEKLGFRRTMIELTKEL